MNAQTLAYLIVSVVSIGSTAEAAVINASPADFQSKIAALKPGDTLNLASGTYPLLYLTNMEGKAGGWITVQGQKPANPPLSASNPPIRTVVTWCSWKTWLTLQLKTCGLIALTTAG